MNLFEAYLLWGDRLKDNIPSWCIKKKPEALTLVSATTLWRIHKLREQTLRINISSSHRVKQYVLLFQTRQASMHLLIESQHPSKWGDYLEGYPGNLRRKQKQRHSYPFLWSIFPLKHLFRRSDSAQCMKAVPTTIVISICLSPHKHLFRGSDSARSITVSIPLLPWASAHLLLNICLEVVTAHSLTVAISIWTWASAYFLLNIC